MKQKRKKEKQSSMNPYSMKTHESAVVSSSSSSPGFLSLFRSKKLLGCRELKLMFKNLKRKKTSEGNPKTRLVRCPKCQKILQEPDNAHVYRCSRCDTVFQSKNWKSEGKAAQIYDSSVSEAIILPSAEECEFRAAKVDSEDAGSVASDNKSSVKETYHVYDAAASSPGTRSYASEAAHKLAKSNFAKEWMRRAKFSKTNDSEAAYAHEKSNSLKEWMRRDKFPTTSDSDMLVPGRASLRSLCSGGTSRDWIHPESSSPSSAFECGSPYNPFHASSSSSYKQSYHDQQKHNHFRQHERDEWSGETSAATSSVHFSGETINAMYYQRSGKSPMHDSRHQGFPGQGLYDYSSSCTTPPRRSIQSEPSYPARGSKCTCSDTDGYGYVREKTQVVKRHVLPAGGGSPFVTCCFCLQVLKLCQEFLHGKKKRYRVRCSDCLGVLEFSLKEKARTITFTPNVLDLRPNRKDGDDSASVDHDKSCPDESPLSCLSYECGSSVCKSSLSYDGELASPCTFQGVAANKDMQNTWNEFSDATPETPKFLMKSLVSEEQRLSENPESGETSSVHLEQSQNAHSEHSWNLHENSNERSEAPDAGKAAQDESGVSMEDMEHKNVKTKEKTEEAETTEEKPVSHRMEPANEDGSTYETLKLTENTGETHEFDPEKYQEEGYNMTETCKFDSEKPREQGEYEGARTRRETRGDRPGMHLEEHEERVPTFRLDESELGKMLGTGEAIEERSETSFRWFLNDNVRESVLHHSEKCAEESENETLENESRNFTEMIEPMAEASEPSLAEQLEREEEKLAEMLIPLDLSQDTPKTPNQTLEPRADDEDRPASIGGETTELIPGDHSEQMQEEDGLTFEPHARLCSTMGPTEMVGLRHALYGTRRSPLQSPLRTPLTSQIHTPVSSPLHSPKASPLHPRIVSPLRSPTNSSPSLSDVLSFSKKF